MAVFRQNRWNLVVSDKDNKTEPLIIAVDGVQVRLAGTIIALSLDRLDVAELNRLNPAVVVCALFSADHDAPLVIEHLALLGYAGQIVVIAQALPNPGLVERELRALGPGPRLHLLADGQMVGPPPH